MAYTPQTWNNGPGGGTPLSAARLTNMETGIDEAHDLYDLGFGATDFAKVSTDESTTSTSFTDLTTSGPSVTVDVPASGKVIVVMSCRISNNTNGLTSNMGYDVSGANTIAATTSEALNRKIGKEQWIFASYLSFLDSLTAGSTTFKAQYRVSGGTGTFGFRTLAVIPI